MIEAVVRPQYQRYVIDPLLRVQWICRIHPNLWTVCSCVFGLLTTPLLALSYPLAAVFCMAMSGFLDTLDGSIARYSNQVSEKGSALDIFSDRLVEFSILLGLYLVDPESRALLTILMLGSVLLCVTSFLVVGIFSNQRTEKSFYYSPGLMERAEAFAFFAAMILFKNAFFVLSLLFSLLVLITAVRRMAQFARQL